MPELTNYYCYVCGKDLFSAKLASTGIPPKACHVCKSYRWNVPFRPGKRMGRKRTKRRRTQ